MRSLLAFLKVLVIPSGAIGGPRVIINGLTGNIEVYDVNNDLILTLGSVLPGTVGLPGLQVNAAGLPLGAAVVLTADPDPRTWFYTGDADESHPGWVKGNINGVGGSRQLSLEIREPGFNVFTPGIELFSDSFDGTVPGYVNIDQTDLQVNQHTVSRGIVENGVFETNVSDAARAAGVNTDASVTAEFVAGRRYRANLVSQFTGGVAGGIYALDLLEDGVLIGRMDRADLEAGATVGFFTSHFLYSPSTTGSHTMVLRNNAGSAGTLQLTAGAGQPRQFWFEDVGAP